MNLDAYFARIGYDGPRAPTIELLRSLHRLHPAAIPFESLDPLLGRPVAIDLASLEDKLVRQRRGGYCFEQNELFCQLLSALAFKVTPLAARVRWSLPQDAPQTPVSHMLLKATLPEGEFICDVGFGGQTPTAPLRFEADEEQVTPHGTYRLRRRGGEFELEMRLPGDWSALYRFTEEPRTARDYEVFNWYTATHPASRFVNNLVAARVVGDGRLTLLNDELTFQGTEGLREHRLLAAPGAVHDVLARDFGIHVGRAEIERVWPRLPRQSRVVS